MAKLTTAKLKILPHLYVFERFPYEIIQKKSLTVKEAQVWFL